MASWDVFFNNDERRKCTAGGWVSHGVIVMIVVLHIWARALYDDVPDRPYLYLDACRHCVSQLPQHEHHIAFILALHFRVKLIKIYSRSLLPMAQQSDFDP